MGIYVEIFIRGTMEEAWQKTQDPALHQRWDLRFSQIEYLPRQPGQAQKFLYTTRIGIGLRIQGEGESTGERDHESGQRTSALKFWSADRKSLIETGSGYWKYIPANDGLVFITWYDYHVRFGAFGYLVDRICFRPLLGSATAWSFDRLRLWIEKGIAPEISRTLSAAYAVVRLILGFVWIYQGLVPKLTFQDPAELQMLRDTGIAASQVHAVTFAAGVLEIAFGIILVFLWRQCWPLYLTIAAMIIAILTVGICSPMFLTAAFNPVTLNFAVAVLALVALLLHPYIPASRRCRRQAPRSEA